jgi:hypothetical protein
MERIFVGCTSTREASHGAECQEEGGVPGRAQHIAHGGMHRIDAARVGRDGVAGEEQNVSTASSCLRGSWHVGLAAVEVEVGEEIGGGGECMALEAVSHSEMNTLKCTSSSASAAGSLDS